MTRDLQNAVVGFVFLGTFRNEISVLGKLWLEPLKLPVELIQACCSPVSTSIFQHTVTFADWELHP